MQRSPRSVDAIVEQQVQKWLAERARARGDGVPRPAPVVAVSREYGARGAELARLVAERLGFACWDQEILHAIARRTHTSERLIAAFDEHHRASILETVRSMTSGGPLSSSEYFRELARLVHSIATHGAAVLVGRGVQFLLPPDQVLRVRVVAPLEARIRGLAERRGLTELDARAEIATVDADRAAFMRDHYGREVDDPTAYDLVVNTGSVPLDAAATIVAAAYEARFPSNQPSRSAGPS